MEATETVTVTISKQSFEFLNALAKKIATQDNRSTARPYFFACQEKREYPVPGEFDYDRIYYMDRHGNEPFDSMEELLENDPKHDPERVRRLYVKDHYETTNVFLTEDGYKEHVEQNRHNMKEPRDFLFHAFRNPEMRGLFKAIDEFIQVKTG